MRGREIPGPGPILSRFCRDLVLSRDNSPNSGSYEPLRDHPHHITNIAIVRLLNRGLLLKLSVSTGTAFQILPLAPANGQPRDRDESLVEHLNPDHFALMTVECNPFAG